MPAVPLVGTGAKFDSVPPVTSMSDSAKLVLALFRVNKRVSLVVSAAPVVAAELVRSMATAGAASPAMVKLEVPSPTLELPAVSVKPTLSRWSPVSMGCVGTTLQVPSAATVAVPISCVMVWPLST